ncbi:putative tRNA(His) guanylyltransferase [Halotydeus destructor]|nr:putative tRNA(His) guanylyltransferase [Halotydeus destructor]
MANSKYEYVRHYEESSDPVLLRDCYAVVRIDGRGFHRFSKVHHFLKPNDKRALDLMNRSAQFVMSEFFPDITMAYGCSDEFSFIFRRSADMFNRRSNKVVSLVASAFTAAYVFHWSKFFQASGDTPSQPLLYPPTFDGRCVLYPKREVLVDYMKWRQVDCHINNLYNTTFYALTGDYTRYSLLSDETGDRAVSSYFECPKPKLSNFDAQERLKGTVSRDKNEIMFTEYGINYNNEIEQFKKGTLICLPPSLPEERKLISKPSKTSYAERKIDFRIVVQDIINGSFWEDNSYLLEDS